MVGRLGRIGGVLTMLLLVLPVPVRAGSSQATLSVAVVVAPRCAVRTSAGEAVSMRCTKGAVPSWRDAAPTAVGPRITRTLLPASALAPHAELITVNF
jgi:hypothetical protein